MKKTHAFNTVRTILMQNNSIDLKTLRLLASTTKHKHSYTSYVIDLLNSASPDKSRARFVLVGLLNSKNVFRHKLGVKEGRLYPAGDFQRFAELILKKDPTLSFVEVATAYHYISKDSTLNMYNADKYEIDALVDVALDAVHRIRAEVKEA